MAILQVLRCSLDVPTSFRRRGGSSLVCEATSLVAGAAWVLLSLQVAVSVCTSASSKRMAPRKSSRAWAAIERQSPRPCPSASHFCRSLCSPSCIPCSTPFPQFFLHASSISSTPFFFPILYPSSVPSLHPSSRASSSSSCTSSWV